MDILRQQAVLVGVSDDILKDLPRLFAPACGGESVSVPEIADDKGGFRFAEIVAALDPDWLQLHGAETPERTREIRQKFGRPVIKALGVADHADLLRTQDFLDVADRLLFDAKPPKNAVLPGGNGLSFDWTLLQNYAGPANWMLSGGLTPENVAEAIRLTRAPGVDVSSGVEDAPGVKSAEKIHAFIKAARAA